MIQADAARHAGRSERGGLLLGLRRGAHLDIQEATLPGKHDRGSMFSFYRSAAGHQKHARRQWQRSGHVIDWVGEWHSHPQSVPTPSSIDLGSWQKIATDRKDQMAFLILGYEDLWLGLQRPGRSRPARYVEVERSALGRAYLPLT